MYFRRGIVYIYPVTKQNTHMLLTDKNPSGTSFHGQTIRATYLELVEILGGEPQYRGGDKSHFDWVCESPSGVLFTVYDWKLWRCPEPNDMTDWHIGAFSAEDAKSALRHLKMALKKIK